MEWHSTCNGEVSGFEPHRRILTQEFPESVNGHTVEEVRRTTPTDEGLQVAYFIAGCEQCREKFAVPVLETESEACVRRAKAYALGHFYNTPCESP